MKALVDTKIGRTDCALPGPEVFVRDNVPMRPLARHFRLAGERPRVSSHRIEVQCLSKRYHANPRLNAGCVDSITSFSSATTIEITSGGACFFALAGRVVSACNLNSSTAF